MQKLWTEEETQFLVNNWKNLSRDQLTKELERNWPCIKTKAKRLNLSSKLIPPAWTDDQINFLKSNWTNSTAKHIQDHLYNKSWVAIGIKAQRLKLKRDLIDRNTNWSTTDENFLKENYSSATQENLINHFSNKTWSAIKQHARVLKLKRSKPNDWTDVEIEVLRTNYSCESQDQLLKQINRSWDAICSKALLLGLVRRDFWEQYEVDALYKYYGRATREQVMQFIPGRTWSAIQGKAALINYKNEPEGSRRCHRIGDMKVLLDGSLASAYWIGVLLADGSFNHKEIKLH